MSKTKLSKPKAVQLPAYCVWGLVCSMSSLDQQRNNLSLFNVIDQFQIPKNLFPKNDLKAALPVPHEIVTLWRRRVNSDIDERQIELDVLVSLMDSQGVPVQQILTKVEIPHGHRLNRFRLQTNVLFFSVPGDYVYEIRYKRPEDESFTECFEVPLLISELK